ncbi:substrate-binding periplasmic protein [Marinicellulosiphila megalodicopiae]|uniref:substrate-binding periplasmic protein n=1 Tax=Marinicellulosiphila megalodicopiae TaxID=2724896 RepID=UPI003BB21D0B
MKRILSTFILMLLLNNQSIADEIRFVGETYCPYLCEKDQEGFMLEIARVVFENNGHMITYQALPWSRALLTIHKNKQADALLSVVKESEPNLIYPTEELGHIKGCYFTSENSDWKYTGLKSLEDITLGLIDNYGYGADPVLAKHIEKFKNDKNRIIFLAGTSTSITQILHMIERGRVSGTTDDQYVVNYTIKKNNITGIRLAGCSGANIPLYIGFSPFNPKAKEYAEILSAGIQTLRKSGELEIILNKYGVSDWK